MKKKAFECLHILPLSPNLQDEIPEEALKAEKEEIKTALEQMDKGLSPSGADPQERYKPDLRLRSFKVNTAGVKIK